MKLSYGILSLGACFIMAIAIDLACTVKKPATPHRKNFLNSLDSITEIFPKTVDEIETRLAAALKQTSQDLAVILSIEPSKQTFENTAVALDRLMSFSDLSLLANALCILENVSPDATMRDAAQKAVLEISNFLTDTINNNVELYTTFKSYARGNALTEKLSPAQKYFIEELLHDFVKSGLDLPEDKRKEVVVIEKELNRLSQIFHKNIADDLRTVTVTRSELAGLSDEFINGLTKNESGDYVLGMDYPTYFMVIDSCTVSDTRKKLSLAFNSRAYPINESIFKDYMAAKDALAQLLGFSSYAHLNLDHSMVETPERAEKFLRDLLGKVNIKTDQEFELLSNNLPSGVLLTPEGKMQPWDVRYIYNAYKKTHHDLDDQVIAQYFPMENTVQGLFDIYSSFFSINFKEIPATHLWHPDARLLEVLSADNTQTLGYIFLDLYPRPNKYGHACKITLSPPIFVAKDGSKSLGSCVVIANFAKSTATTPSLLKHSDVQTFFHEFGHALHHLLGQTELASQSGTSVKRDFVELPSQILEEWLWDKEILKNLTSHYQRGESLPDELIKKLLELKNFESGNWSQRQIYLSLISLEYFKAGASKDPQKIAQELSALICPHIEPLTQDNRAYSFGHLVGYGPQYYGYLWSRVFAHDIFELIKQHGLLDPVIGKKYVDTVLSKGGTADPNELLYNFLGRVPTQDAFLKNLGL